MVTRALLEGLLGGLRYPATPEELAAELRSAGTGADVLAAIARLRAPAYGSANEVGEELFPVEPEHVRRTREPHAESGAPPGGDRYTNGVDGHLAPGSGAARLAAQPAGSHRS